MCHSPVPVLIWPKQIEYKSLRMRRELATTPAWVLSRGIVMAKTENRRLRWYSTKPHPRYNAHCSWHAGVSRFSVFEVLIQWHIYERSHRLTSTEKDAVDREKELHLPRRKEHWVRVCAVLELHLPLSQIRFLGQIRERS